MKVIEKVSSEDCICNGWECPSCGQHIDDQDPYCEYCLVDLEF